MKSWILIGILCSLSLGCKARQASPAMQDAATGTSRLDIDTRSWMTTIYQNHPDRSLTSLFIPGTHDSATSYISAWSPITPGASKFYGAPIVQRVVVGWSRCQTRSIKEQLEDGVRSFDLRTTEYKNNIWIAHGLLSVKLDTVLKEMLAFSTKYPKEIIIIHSKLDWDFHKNLSNPNEKNQDHLNAIVMQLGSRLYRGHDYRLGALWAEGKSFILNPQTRTEWFNAQNAEDLKARADRFVQYSGPAFNELSLVLTPTEENIKAEIVDWAVDGVLDWAPNALVGDRSAPILQKWQFEVATNASKWLKDYHNRGLNLNVVSIDFIQATGIIEALLEMNQTSVKQP